jgi:CAAX protease family protein
VSPVASSSSIPRHASSLEPLINSSTESTREQQPVRGPAPLSPRAVVLVLLATVGVFIISSAAGLLFRGEGRLTGFQIRITNPDLVSAIVYQTAVLAVLARFLRSRGWRLEHVTLPFASRDVGRGIGIWFLALLTAWATLAIVFWLAPVPIGRVLKTTFEGDLNGALIAAYSLVNPLFEELTLLGFVSAAFRSSPVWQVFLLSLALRAAAHTYQGMFAALTVIPVGLVFTWYYLRRGRLWPVVLAHSIQDALALSLLGVSRS